MGAAAANKQGWSRLSRLIAVTMINGDKKK